MLNLDVLNRCWVTEFPCGHILSEKKKKNPLGLQQLVTETISSKVAKPLGVDKVTSVLFCFGTISLHFFFSDSGSSFLKSQYQVMYDFIFTGSEITSQWESKIDCVA